MEFGPELNHIHVNECKVLVNRYNLLEHLPKNAIAAEIGTYKGIFSKDILSVCNPKELHLVDINAIKRIDSNNKIIYYRGDSSKVIKEQFPNDYFDWIYIDADHTYEGVYKDAHAAIPKLKKDGLLIFNDYIVYDYVASMPYGVIKVVNDLCYLGWKIKFLTLIPTGFLDVALVRQ